MQLSPRPLGERVRERGKQKSTPPVVDRQLVTFFCFAKKKVTIDTSIIHDTLAVIANEVKQSSKTKMHFV